MATLKKQAPEIISGRVIFSGRGAIQCSASVIGLSLATGIW